MESRVSRFLPFFRSICHLTEASIFDPSKLLLLPLSRSHFSSLPNRPSRGGKRDERSEDLFLRNLNFGDEGDVDEKRKERSHRSPADSPGEPIGGDQQMNAGEDFFSGGRSSPTRIPNRPMRGERREEGNLRQSLDLGGEGSMEKYKSFRDSSPSRFADRAPRREEKHDLSEDSSFNGAKLRDRYRSPSREHSGEKIGSQSVSSFIENLKFGGAGGGEKEEKPRQAASSQMDSALPESSLQDADEIFKKMKETGMIPNAVAMLDGLCKDGLIQEAMKLFGLMREKGTIPEVVIYTAVVEGFCKAAKYDDAIRIFRKMQKNGIVPNAFSFTVLIQGLCKGNRLEDSVDFCLEMLDAAHSPNVVTFTGLVKGFCEEKGVEEAASVIRRLRERGLAIDEKAVKEHLDKKGPFSPLVWEAIFGKKSSQRVF